MPEQEAIADTLNYLFPLIKRLVEKLQHGHFKAMMRWLHDAEDIDAALMEYIARERSRPLTNEEAEELFGRMLLQIEKCTELTIDDLEKRMSETYGTPVWLLPPGARKE